MMHFVDKITDKKGWERKVFDEGIAEKWRAEAGVGDEESEEDEEEGKNHTLKAARLTPARLDYVSLYSFPCQSLILVQCMRMCANVQVFLWKNKMTAYLPN